MPARCAVQAHLVWCGALYVALYSFVRGLEVPVDKCHVQCPWRVTLLVPVVRYFYLIYGKFTTDTKKNEGTNEPRTNGPRTKQQLIERIQVHVLCTMYSTALAVAYVLTGSE